MGGVNKPGRRVFLAEEPVLQNPGLKRTRKDEHIGFGEAPVPGARRVSREVSGARWRRAYKETREGVCATFLEHCGATEGF